MRRLKSAFPIALAAVLVAVLLVSLALPTPTLAAGRADNAPVSPSPAWFGSTCIHTVVFGDNLFRLSLRFHTTVSELMFANGLRNPNLIFIGMPLRVPCVSFIPSFVFFPVPFFVPSHFFVPFGFSSMFSFRGMFP